MSVYVNEKRNEEKMKAPKFSYFNQGVIPVISCVDKSTVKGAGYTFKEMIDAMAIALEKDFVPVWGSPAKLQITKEVEPGTWGIVFTDTADDSTALGYHWVTDDGMPMGKVFVATSMQYGEEPSVTASHELYEMLIDPAVQMLAVNYKTGIIYAYEVADAIQTETYSIGKVPVSNFHYPSWFESFQKPKSATNPNVKFDHLGTCKKPFEIRPGGYMSIFQNGVWSQIFGSKRARAQFIPELHPRAILRAQRGEEIKLRAPEGAKLAVISPEGAELVDYQPLPSEIV